MLFHGLVVVTSLIASSSGTVVVPVVSFGIVRTVVAVASPEPDSEAVKVDSDSCVVIVVVVVSMATVCLGGSCYECSKEEQSGESNSFHHL